MSMIVEGDGLRDRRSQLYKKFLSLVSGLESLPGSHWFLPTKDLRGEDGRSLSLGSVKKKLEGRKYFTKADLAEDIKSLFSASGSGDSAASEGGDEESDIKIAAATMCKVFEEGYQQISDTVSYGGDGTESQKPHISLPKLTANGKKRGPPFKKDRHGASNSALTKDELRDFNARKTNDDLKEKLAEEMESFKDLSEKVDILRKANVNESLLSNLLHLAAEVEAQHKVVCDLANAEEERLVTKAKIELKKREMKAVELQKIREEKEREAAALAVDLSSGASVDKNGTIAETEGIEERDENEAGDEDEEEEEGEYKPRFTKASYGVVLLLNGEKVIRGEGDQQVNTGVDGISEASVMGEGFQSDLMRLVIREQRKNRVLPKALKANMPNNPNNSSPGKGQSKGKAGVVRSMIPRHLLNKLNEEEKQVMMLNYLCDYLKECGAPEDISVSSWKVELEFKGKSNASYDTIYFNSDGKKFRSRAEIARWLKLPNAPVTKRIAGANARRNKAQELADAKAKAKKESEARAAQQAHERELEKLAALSVLATNNHDDENKAMSSCMLNGSVQPSEVSYSRKAQSELKALQNAKAKLERALVREKEKREQVRYPIDDHMLEFEPPPEPPLPPRPPAGGEGLCYEHSLEAAPSYGEDFEEIWCSEGQRVWHSKYGPGEVDTVGYPWIWVKFENAKVMKKAKSKAVKIQALSDHDPQLAESERTDSNSDETVQELESDVKNEDRADTPVSTECLSSRTTENLFASLGCLNAFGRHPDYFQDDSILSPWVKCFNKQSKLPASKRESVLGPPNGFVDVETFRQSLSTNGAWSRSAHECLLKMIFESPSSDPAWVLDSVYEEVEQKYAERLSGGRGNADDHSIWKKEGSPYVGVAVTRSVYDDDDVSNKLDSSSPTVELVKGVIIGWLPEDESDFVNCEGKPAALYRVEYTTGSLQGDGEDLEERELWASLPPDDVESLKQAQIVATKARKKRKLSIAEEDIDNNLKTGKRDRKKSKAGEDLEDEDETTDSRSSISKRSNSKKAKSKNRGSNEDGSSVKLGRRYDDKVSKFLALHSIKLSEIRGYEKPSAAEVTSATWKHLSLALAIAYLKLWRHQNTISAYQTNLKEKTEEESLEADDVPSNASAREDRMAGDKKVTSDQLQVEPIVYDKNFDRVDNDTEVLASLEMLSSYDEASLEDKINILYTLVYAACETDIASSIFMLQQEDRVALEGNWLIEDRELKKIKKEQQIKIYILARKRIAARRRCVDGYGWSLLSDYDCVHEDDGDDYGVSDDDEEDDLEVKKRRKSRKSIDKVKKADSKNNRKEEGELELLECPACQGDGNKHTCPEGLEVLAERKLEMKSVAPYFVQQEVLKMVEAETCGGTMSEPFFVLDQKFIVEMIKKQEAHVETIEQPDSMIDEVIEEQKESVEVDEGTHKNGESPTAVAPASPTMPSSQVEVKIAPCEELHVAGGHTMVHSDSDQINQACAPSIVSSSSEDGVKESNIENSCASPVPVILKGGLKIRPIKKRNISDDIVNNNVENIVFKKANTGGKSDESAIDVSHLDTTVSIMDQDSVKSPETEASGSEQGSSKHLDSQEDYGGSISINQLNIVEKHPLKVDTEEDIKRREGIEFMRLALASGDIEELRQALVIGRELGFEGVVTSDLIEFEEAKKTQKLGLIEGSKWVSELQRDVYVALKANTDMKVERRRMVSRRIEANRLTPARVCPLGVDKYNTAYFSYLSDPMKSRIWIQEAPRALRGSDGIFGSESMCWISSLEDISALARSLDRRGIHEKQLQEALLAHLEVLSHSE